MSANSTLKRQHRIERRCIAPVVAALHAGQISARSADAFLRLNPDQQAVELERRLAAAHQREMRHQLVAEAIRGYLDTRNGGRVDLIELGGIIKEALA